MTSPCYVPSPAELKWYRLAQALRRHRTLSEVGWLALLVGMAAWGLAS
jgi:hypothetical protein